MRTVVGDKAGGIVGSTAKVYSEADNQHCAVHFCRNVFACVPKSRRAAVAAMLKAIHAMEPRVAVEVEVLTIADELEGCGSRRSSGFLRDPDVHGLPTRELAPLRTINAIERQNREIRRRTRVAVTFSDGRSALMLFTARLK